MNLTTSERKALAEACLDAYSTRNYGGSWLGCVTYLDRKGFTYDQIKFLIFSKHMRWAADQSTKDYGRVTSTDLDRYLKRNKITIYAVEAEMAYYRALESGTKADVLRTAEIFRRARRAKP